MTVAKKHRCHPRPQERVFSAKYQAAAAIGRERKSAVSGASLQEGRSRDGTEMMQTVGVGGRLELPHLQRPTPALVRVRSNLACAPFLSVHPGSFVRPATAAPRPPRPAADCSAAHRGGGRYRPSRQSDYDSVLQLRRLCREVRPALRGHHRGGVARREEDRFPLQCGGVVL